MQISHPAFSPLHMDATLEEVLDWAEEMERVRAALILERGEFPGPSALCESFDRAPMRIWRELLNQSGHAAIGATYFDRRQASTHYLSRRDRNVQTVQASSSSLPRRARLSTFTVARSGRTKRMSSRRSPCGTQATCGASLPTKATTT